MGKGSRNRTTNHQAYAQGHDRIFGRAHNKTALKYSQARAPEDGTPSPHPANSPQSRTPPDCQEPSNSPPTTAKPS